MEHLILHPEIKHGKVRIGFTPDEEIGCGADHFDVKKFGADFAYTMDGGAIGELEFENFNAACCKIRVHGLNVHPGSAYHKMRNSMRVAYQLAVMLPRWETPEHTQGYEGFYHLTSMNGTVEETTLSYIIRDHDRARFESRKRELEHLVRKVNREYGEGTAEIEMRDQYYNMREQIEPAHHRPRQRGDDGGRRDTCGQTHPWRNGRCSSVVRRSALPQHLRRRRKLPQPL